MANNFKIIYKILSSLEKAMEYEKFDEARISPQALEYPGYFGKADYEAEWFKLQMSRRDRTVCGRGLTDCIRKKADNYNATYIETLKL